VNVAGSHSGVAIGQSAPVRHCTQVNVTRSQCWGATHWLSPVQATQAPAAVRQVPVPHEPLLSSHDSQVAGVAESSHLGTLAGQLLVPLDFTQVIRQRLALLHT
jgi:hypothetical protein